MYNPAMSHYYAKGLMKPRGLNVRCLKCPKSKSGEFKEWDLKDMEEPLDYENDLEWRSL